MIIQFKSFSTGDLLLTTNVTAQEWTDALNTGMLHNLRLQAMLIHPYEHDDEVKDLVWYSFESAKAGLPPFVVRSIEE